MTASPTPRQIRLLLRCRARVGGRWLRAHAFVVLVLGPLVLGFVGLIAESFLGEVAAALAARAGAWPPAMARLLYPLACALALLVLAAALPAAARRVYGLGPGDASLEALPVTPAARCHAILAERLLAALGPWAAVLAALTLLAGGGAAWAAIHAASTLLAFAHLALLEVVLVLALGRWRLLRAAPLLGLGLGVLALAVAAAPHPGARLALPPLLALEGAALGLLAPLGEIFGVAPPAPPVPPWLLRVASPAALYLLALVLFRRWRAAGREAAAAFLARRRRAWLSHGVLALTRRALPGAAPPTLAQLARDWLLIRRGFSPAVVLAVALAVLWQGLLVLAAARWSLPAAALGRLALVCCAASVASLTPLAPVLLRHQLPYLWLERVSGAVPDTLWRAKLWLCRLLAAGVVLLALPVTLVVVPLPPVARLLLALELLGVAALGSSVSGYVVFQGAGRPLLGAVLVALSGLAASGLLIAYPLAWPFLAYFYFMTHGSMAQQAGQRARMLEVEE